LPSGKNPCFVQLDQNGLAATGTTTQDGGWAQETALDLEMASAACPKCSLLLVEGATASFEALSSAVSVATDFEGVRAISNSYGGNDVTPDRFGQYALAAAKAIAVTASSGDSGFGVSSPASFDGVIAVGGTSLSVDASGAWLNESAWAGSGSGCSKLNAKPSWQTFVATDCDGKVTADVSAVADPATGVSVYFNGGWYVFGGTSASSPLIAGLYALKNDFGLSPGDYTAANSISLHDVTVGTNAISAAAKHACNVRVWCNAGVGFDGPTGYGTPFGTDAF
jgi:subtilase family serine protease